MPLNSHWCDRRPQQGAGPPRPHTGRAWIAADVCRIAGRVLAKHRARRGCGDVPWGNYIRITEINRISINAINFDKLASDSVSIIADTGAHLGEILVAIRT